MQNYDKNNPGKSHSKLGFLVVGIVIGSVCSLFVMLVVLAIFETSMTQMQASRQFDIPSSLDTHTTAVENESPYQDIFDAARLGFVQDVKFFIEKGVDVNAKGVNAYEDNKTGVTALHFAAKYNVNIDVLKYLIAQGADVNRQTDAHSTPLHYAAVRNSNIAVSEYLIEKGADINIKNVYGVTPLHLAARFSTDVTKCLIDNGADVNAKDNAGRTPIDFSRAMNRDDCEAVLREAGGKSGEEL